MFRKFELHRAQSRSADCLDQKCGKHHVCSFVPRSRLDENKNIVLNNQSLGNTFFPLPCIDDILAPVHCPTGGGNRGAVHKRRANQLLYPLCAQ